jgi:hypothetical protein
MSEIKIGDFVGPWEIVGIDRASKEGGVFAAAVDLECAGARRTTVVATDEVARCGTLAALTSAMVRMGMLEGDAPRLRTRNGHHPLPVDLTGIVGEHERMSPEEMRRACAEYIALGMQSATANGGGGAPGKPIADSPLPSWWRAGDSVVLQPNGEVSIGGRVYGVTSWSADKAAGLGVTFARLSGERDHSPPRGAALDAARVAMLADEVVRGVLDSGPFPPDNSRAAIHARMLSDHPSAVEARRIVRVVETEGCAVMPMGWRFDPAPLRITDAEGVVWYDATEAGPGIAHLRSLERPPLSVLVDDPSGEDVAADWRRG